MTVMKSKELVTNVGGNTDTGQEWVVVRIDGKDHVVENVTKSYDGVLGNTIVLHARPIGEVL